MSRSSVTRRNSDFSRRISVAASCAATAAGLSASRCARNHWYRLQAETPKRCATSRTGYPRTTTCFTASALNSAVYRD